MSRRRTHALAAAALLAAGALAPGNVAPAAELTCVGDVRPVVAAPETAAIAAAVEAPEPEASPEVSAAAVQDAPSKRKADGFVRVLTAPFRALARLFGSRKPSDAAAKKPSEKQAAPNLAAAQPAPEAPANSAGPRVSDKPAAPPVAEQGVNIVRPDEQSLALPQPSVWVPFIEGVAKDPLEQGRALLERGHLGEAIAELSVAAATGQNLAEANNLLGLTYDRLGWHRQAAEAYERGLSASPQDPVLLTNLGYSLYLSNNFGGALKRLRQAARLAPDFPLVHNHLGLVQARLGKYDDAFKSFARAVGEYDAHLKLASMLEFENRERRAIKHYEAALRLQPGATAVLERLVALYERTGDPAKADTARRTLGKPKNEQRTTTGGG
ncbi:MAG TPA: tetratricopeptide repeat protein [Pyrinomonadaceae bacterium]|nr:tetratricopeptide repeat protein [Pyrinomonadaceae bacterium]